MKDCLQKPRDVARPIAKGKVFHLDEASVIVTPTISQGKLSIHNFTTRALIDTGAIYSFVSCEFAKNLIVELQPLR